MGMYAPKSLETPRSHPDPGKIGDPDVLIVAHNHIGNRPFTGHQQGNLAIDFTGNGGNLAGQFVGDNLAGGYPAAVQILESLLLTGLQAVCFAQYVIDSQCLYLELQTYM